MSWIEWYISNDGASSETPLQIGQRSPIVSVVLALVLALLLRRRPSVASKEELMDTLDIELRQMNELRMELNEHGIEILENASAKYVDST